MDMECLSFCPMPMNWPAALELAATRTATIRLAGAFDELETFASPLNGGIAPAETYWLGIPDYQGDPNGTLGAWEMAYFGHLGVDPYGDYDNNGTNNLQEFLNGADPNKISFSFSVPNQYVTTNLVDGVITILGGVPSSIAVLVDNTNFAGQRGTPTLRQTSPWTLARARARMMCGLDCEDGWQRPVRPGRKRP